MSSGEERIYVSVRLRPLNSKEILRNDVSDWECVNNKTIVYKNVGFSATDRSMYPSAYTFDRVFRSACSTREVYDEGAKDVAISVVSGMNSSVFAYGQTSSGKTYTMTGITEYAIADIYEYIEKHPERKFILRFSAMEIYNESVQDLLSSDSTPLRLLDDPERGTIVEKLTEEILTDWDHVMQLLSVCEAQRQIGETSLNETSSRSHQIMRLTIESSSREFISKENASTLTATVNFVDLAGSERASQSLSAGARLKEGCHINRSLLTLGTVVRKLSKGRTGHIPYRDSKLTRILQTSLGGNARTAIICTMSPARSHVEQSRNTLLFASCAKEVSTNAQVNVVMSDKALVKHLQREIDRLESERRTTNSNSVPLNYVASLREKDLQIEKLENDVKELILERDIAQSQVKELLQIIGDNDAGSAVRAGVGHYPHLRVQHSPDDEIVELEKSIVADPHSSDVDDMSHSRTSSEDHFAKIPSYFEEKFVANNGSPRVLTRRSSNFSESDSCHEWEEIEKRSNNFSEDLCTEVRCVETEESSYEDDVINSSPHDKEKSESCEVSMSINGDDQDLESASTPYLAKDQEFALTLLNEDKEMSDSIESGPIPLSNEKELISASMEEEKEEKTPIFEKGKEFGSMRFVDMSFLEKLTQDSSERRSFKFSKSRSCRESVITGSSSPWFKMMDYSENTNTPPSVVSEWKTSSWNFGVDRKKILKKDSRSSPENALDIEIDAPNVKFSTDDYVSSGAGKKREKSEVPTEEDIMKLPVKEIEPKTSELPKKSVKDVGLDPIEDDRRVFSSWPVEFKKLQREIIELWQACNVSLVHRAYFYLFFQGDPTDAIYLEVEMRRMKFLKDKFSRGEKTIVNGRQITLDSSAKALHHERRMLSKQMAKKLSEHERESLFLKWGIGLNTKLRRLQLANRIWTNTEDMNHIADSAFLVVKLIGFIDPGQTPKEMFGLNFTPRNSTRTYSFKRSLISIL